MAEPRQADDFPADQGGLDRDLRLPFIGVVGPSRRVLWLGRFLVMLVPVVFFAYELFPDVRSAFGDYARSTEGRVQFDAALGSYTLNATPD